MFAEPNALKAYVIQHIPPESYYARRFPNWDSRTRPNVLCVFHPDTKPSLSLNLDGGGARCHASGCGKSVGNIVHFESARLAISENDAAKNLFSEFIKPVVPAQNVSLFRSHLTTAGGKRLIDVLHSDYGVSLDTLAKFGCGFDPRSNRLVIPIVNAFGLVVNLRFYKPKKWRTNSDVTLYNYVTSKGTPEEVKYGGNELFHWPSLLAFSIDRPVFVMASEKETMLALQMGLQAVCATAGEGSWLDEWTETFVGFRVGLLMDPDAGGDKASKRLVSAMESVSISCTPLRLPFPPGYGGTRDFDDWVVRGGGTSERLMDLFDHPPAERGHSSLAEQPPPAATRRYLLQAGTGDRVVGPKAVALQSRAVVPTTGPKLPPAYAGGSLPLLQIRRRTEVLNMTVKTTGLVSGMAQRSFDLPWKFRIQRKTGPPTIFTVPVGRELLSFLSNTDKNIERAVLELAGAPLKTSTAKPIEYHPVTELEIIPLAEENPNPKEQEEDAAEGYIVQRCFAIGTHLEANTPYNFTMVPTTLPQTQEKVCVVMNATQTSQGIDRWTFDEKAIAKLDQFRVPSSEKKKGMEAVWNHLQFVPAQIAEHATHIYERPDWHIAALLTWLSPLQWTWPADGRTQRGWLNTLAVGDTKTGKSEVVQSLRTLLSAGEVVNSENCTYVGLVGGAIKSASGQLMLRWGRIPLCDRKLVVLEELSGLRVDEISNMSDVRSSGVARLDKGGLASQTFARTRLLCLSNVRSQHKTLAQYLNGVKAIQELVGHAEDISRFDLICTLTDDEVPSAVINRKQLERQTKPNTEPPAWLASMRDLCRFVWALKSQQITFLPQSVECCLRLVEEMSKDYHAGVPIFKASSDRYKLARVAAAIACVQFNWNGKEIEVNEFHMEAAARFMRGLYDKPSLGYRDWSRQMFDRENVKDNEDLETKWRRLVPAQKLSEQMVDSLLHITKFSRDELAAIGGFQLYQADQLISALFQSRVIRHGEANTWEVTPAGKRWLVKFDKQPWHDESRVVMAKPRRLRSSPSSSSQNGHSAADVFDSTPADTGV
jgi:hypothetical protein